MEWNRKDWIDLLLMVMGAMFGVTFLGFVIAPSVGVELVPNRPGSYLLAAIAGTLGGYLIRFSVSRFRSRE